MAFMTKSDMKINLFILMKHIFLLKMYEIPFSFTSNIIVKNDIYIYNS